MHYPHVVSFDDVDAMFVVDVLIVTSKEGGV